MALETGGDARRARAFGWFGAPSSVELHVENARLRERLKDCEVAAARNALLLREGDHRIKNSLAIVASLMQLQARREDSPSASLALRGAAARVQAIARIHDTLQDNHGEDTVDIGRILETMCQALHAMAGDSLSAKVFVRTEPIEAPAIVAQPIVLAVNELVVNALRHAFPDGRPGTVVVSLTRGEDHLRVVVADDGVGLPPAYEQGRGYGMTLVRAMATQVGGALQSESQGGARFEFIVPTARALQPVG